MTKNVVIYIRVSTQGQVGEDSYGLDVQRKDCMKYCEDNDMNIVKIYQEEGVSGATLERPELTKLLNGEVTHPPIDAVVVPKTDRVARDVNLYYYIKYNLKKKNIDLISVQDDYSVYGAMGNIMESIIVSFAEFEKNMITSRTSNGRKEKSKTGGFSGGKPPYGYKAVENELVIVENEAAVIRDIFAARETGLSYRKIADALNELELTTKKGNQWYASNVSYIVKNEKFYRGFYKYGDGSWVEGVHKAIL